MDPVVTIENGVVVFHPTAILFPILHAVWAAISWAGLIFFIWSVVVLTYRWIKRGGEWGDGYGEMLGSITRLPHEYKVREEMEKERKRRKRAVIRKEARKRLG